MYYCDGDGGGIEVMGGFAFVVVAETPDGEFVIMVVDCAELSLPKLLISFFIPCNVLAQPTTLFIKNRKRTHLMAKFLNPCIFINPPLIVTSPCYIINIYILYTNTVYTNY